MKQKEIISKAAVAGTKEVVRQNSTTITRTVFGTEVGRKVGTSLVNASRSTPIYGAAARSAAGISLRSATTVATEVNPGVAAAATAIAVIPDTLDYVKGNISGGEYAKKTTTNVASTGGAIYGAAQGATAGLAVGGPVGAVVGSVLGGILGGEIVGKCTKGILSLFD